MVTLSNMSTLSHQVQQRVEVPFQYPVHFGRNLFGSSESPLPDLLRQGSGRCLVWMDSGVAEAFPELSSRIQNFLKQEDGIELLREPNIIPGGEAIKNDYRRIMSLVDELLEYHLCRHSTVIVIGGGALLDAAGFVCSIVHRGVRLIRMPSTTLAQNDAGIGVKNGLNLHGMKNSIGCFAPPFAVLNDLDLLTGLDERGWRDGISEAFKVAMIKDSAFFQELCDLAPALARRDPAAMERLVIRCAELHLEHIATSGDPFEMGSARPLDFGHWSAHKLESLSNHRISHGEAVAVGIALDSLLAAEMGDLHSEEVRQLLDALKTLGFNLFPDELTLTLGDGSLALEQGLEEFREHLGGELSLSIPSPLGSIREVHDLSSEQLQRALAGLRELACA